MAVLFEQIGAELSFIRAQRLRCDWNRTLHFCRTEVASSETYKPTPDDDLLHDILLKGIQRGERPFASYFTEERLVALYGRCIGLHLNERTRGGSITYSHDGTLPDRYTAFTDVVAPWQGTLDAVAFDPEHPENERELFARLVQRFGPRIAHFVTPQAEVSKTLPQGRADAFPDQRLDFFLSFPNGRCLVIEPGDHVTAKQRERDEQRDEAFRECGIVTIRPENRFVRSESLYNDVEQHLRRLQVLPYLRNDSVPRRDDQHDISCLFLLPSLVARFERLLAHFFLRQGLVHRPELRVGVVERDLECAEIGFASFNDRLSRLARLYGIPLKLPRMEIYVQRKRITDGAKLGQLAMPVETRKSLDGLTLDLLLDVGIKCNALTKPATTGASHVGSVRQSFRHNGHVQFGYRAKVRPISLEDGTDAVLGSFVRDFFRKRALRPGQAPILRNILSQRATIGLLPTSAGKSLCYQLAALLTPGTTIVVDPIVALMQDQVQGLDEEFGIGRILAWHAAARLHDKDKDVAALLAENIIVFITPERLQRPGFRAAMGALSASSVFVNYAVIDEAHCISMWGHDFRPAYLRLERNFREYCSFQGREPIIVALTGTASQLVLIDLKRELNIEDPGAIIRPDTFDRPELNFNLVRCPSTDATKTLKKVMKSISLQLNVQNLDTEAYGIVFAYTPKELWDLFGLHVGHAGDHILTVLNADRDENMRYGIYTGKPPEGAGFDREQWKAYTSRTLAAFKRGGINMLFGNTAVGLGIDNERLNYIINHRMPQSMEAYYQQCGRAGRSGQHSECWLIFSDDMPAVTQQWLNEEIPKMPDRWDDLGTVAYFFEISFPGQEVDIQGAMRVFQELSRTADEQGLVPIPQYLTPDTPPNQAERTERYISYWLVLGVLVDYEVTGTEKNTVYRVRRHEIVETFLRDRLEQPLRAHLVDSLHRYLSRYRPTSRAEIEKGLAALPKKPLSARCLSYLVNFLYGQIQYQRREAIRTMVAYCNEKDTSPERLRERVRAYFDRSEKFSPGLMTMADAKPVFAAVRDLLSQVRTFDDAEQLYWETRRLLDERFRPDWAAAHLFAIAYRERGVVSDDSMVLLDRMVTELHRDPAGEDGAANPFLHAFLEYLSRLDGVFDGGNVSGPLLARCMSRLYKSRGLAYLGLIDEMVLPDDVRDLIRCQVVVFQLKEMADAQYSRAIG